MGAAVANNKIYVVGGRKSGNNYLTTIEEYNPITNSWQTKANMITGRFALGVVEANNKIYSIGGQSNSASFSVKNEEYDPTSNSWTSKINMPTARNALISISVNNKIYVISGAPGYMKTNEEYIPPKIYYFHCKN